MRVAAFDCGTNSLRLLICQVEGGQLRELVREMRVVRLGEGVDATGQISEAAMGRTFAAVEEYMRIVAEQEVDRIRFCATSAARDATNAREFSAGIRERVAVAPEVLDGGAEAQASFVGATRGLASAKADSAGPLLVVDIGGGSTELALGTQAGEITSAQSLDIGSVRFSERHLRSDPPTEAQIAAARADIQQALDQTHVPIAETKTLIGVAGTVTTIAAGALGLTEYDRERVHRSTIDVATVRRLVNELVSSGVEQRRNLGYVHPGRVDVIGGGALILEQVIERAGVAEILVSEEDILDGIAWSLLGA